MNNRSPVRVVSGQEGTDVVKNFLLIRSPINNRSHLFNGFGKIVYIKTGYRPVIFRT